MKFFGQKGVYRLSYEEENCQFNLLIPKEAYFELPFLFDSKKIPFTYSLTSEKAARAMQCSRYENSLEIIKKAFEQCVDVRNFSRIIMHQFVDPIDLLKSKRRIAEEKAPKFYFPEFFNNEGKVSRVSRTVSEYNYSRSSQIENEEDNENKKEAVGQSAYTEKTNFEERV